MKRVGWQIDDETYNFVKKQARDLGLSDQQYVNQVLKKYRLKIEIATVEGEPEIYKCPKCSTYQPVAINGMCVKCGHFPLGIKLNRVRL